MARAYTSGLLDTGHVVTAWLIELETLTSWIRYNTSDWTLQWNGETWLSGNRVIQIKHADEDMSGQTHGCIVTVGATDPATTSLAMSETLEGRVGVIYRALFNPTTFAIVEVVREYSGRISNVVLTKQGL